MRIAINDRVLLPIFALVGCSMAVLLGFVWFSAVQQDEVAVEQSANAAAYAIQDQMRQIGAVAREFSWRNDSVRHLDIAFSENWTDSNLGYYVHGQYDYDMSFVIDRNGDTIYGHMDGRRVVSSAEQMLRGGIERLIDQAHKTPWREPQSKTGLLALEDGGIVLVGVCAVSLEKGSTIHMMPGRRVIVVLARRLTTDFISSIAGALDLKNVSLREPGEPDQEGTLPLRSPDGDVIAKLTWEPYQPGQQFLASVAPLLIGAVVAILGFTWLLIWRVRSSTKAIEAKEARFRDVANASSDWIWETDAKGKLCFLSDRFAEATGTELKDVLGQPFSKVLKPVAKADQLKLIQDIETGRQFRNVQFIYVKRGEGQEGGKSIYLRVAGTPILDENRRFRGLRGTATDITKETEAEKKIQHLAMHDALTDLPNRVMLREKIAEAIERSSETGGKAAVLCIDLDRFKEINDTLGHSAGDLLISGCADRLRSAVRDTDTVARIGGDEFAVVQTGVEQPEGAHQLCRRLLKSVTRPYDLDGHEVLVTASIGVSVAASNRATPERLMQKADIALYRAKEDGRNAYRFYEAGMDSFLHQRKKLERDLRAALARRELELYYQPKMELDRHGEDMVRGAEALVRWHHPDQRLILPNEFIGLAEETGLILGLGEWVLHTACAQAARWPDLSMSLNISPVQFKHHDLVSMVRRCLQDSKVEPERIELEITEGVLLRNTEAAVSTLKQLKDLGVRIVMDDFGTRYSGLSYLLKFPFDKIKIDQAFVRGLKSRRHADAIIRAVVGLGHSLGMRICAEGVETEEQLSFLKNEGCDEIQGFYVGKPMPVHHFERSFIATESEAFASEARYVAAQ